MGILIEASFWFFFSFIDVASSDIGPFTTISVTGWLLWFTLSVGNFIKLYPLESTPHSSWVNKPLREHLFCWPVMCKIALLQWEISCHSSRKSCSRNGLQTSLIKLKCCLHLNCRLVLIQINFLLKTHYETYHQVLSVYKCNCIF